MRLNVGSSLNSGISISSKYSIRKLEKMGIPITVGDHSNYRTEKKPVRMEYLDDIDIPEFKELPTFSTGTAITL